MVDADAVTEDFRPLVEGVAEGLAEHYLQAFGATVGVPVEITCAGNRGKRGGRV